MTLNGNVAQAPPMRSKLLRCLGLPSIRWVPSDIPSEGSMHQSQHRSLLSSFKAKQSPSSSSSKAKNKENNGRPIHRRKSNISLTSDPDPELDRRTHAQGQSGFFGKLPIEVRLMVYEELFVGEGGEVVHLTIRQKGRFGNFVCEEKEKAGTDGMECGCKVLVGGKDCKKIGGWRVDVLKTCRRMYSEAIRYLYIPHTFSLLHITHLLYLPTRLPSPRLDQIRTLRLRWAIRALPYLRRGTSKKYAYPEDTANWARAWDTMASMKGLRDLYVVLSDPSPANTWEAAWGENQGKLMADVKKVVQTRWFMLMVPYESCDTHLDMGECKVILRRPDGESEEEDG
ncbi:hypothetical protein P154DRAFT_522141 [Amniculicola lignicola CBS 123094]|uniref:DUF7730 domain-containing protein n=1 Tax=Amniculicola lignicola CBS 123094 TaxID=1392246 RepID=A0A6A5WGV7_9PLEO|nr:hypothetical protein P154DRAFT_522141 [Amniculicola lignicola CBS 123094]